MRVVIAGPGRIGCGFLAPLFRRAGWEVVLAARTEGTAERIRRAAGFRVRITGEDVPEPRAFGVCGVTAVAVGGPGFELAVAGSDLVCTSVGVGNVEALAEPLARALARRPADRPLDVWTVENGDCAALLEGRVRRLAGRIGLELPPVGFAGAIAKPAVAHGEWSRSTRPEFVGDAFRTLCVDGSRTTRPLPELPGVVAVRDYTARLREKLYVFNAGHAICAYLGWLRGHRTVAEAVADTFLRPLVAGSLLESRRALLTLHPELSDDLHGPVAEALARYTDPELADPLVRVARDPIRKLASQDRLIGPAELIRDSTGELPAYFALGAAGALLFRGDRRPETLELTRRLGDDGVRRVLEDVCGLPREDELSEAIASRYCGFIVTEETTYFPPVHAPANGVADAPAPTGAAA